MCASKTSRSLTECAARGNLKSSQWRPVLTARLVAPVIISSSFVRRSDYRVVASVPGLYGAAPEEHHEEHHEQDDQERADADVHLRTPFGPYVMRPAGQMQPACQRIWPD